MMRTRQPRTDTPGGAAAVGRIQAMTIDPDDYDLRELRRIADERRDADRTDDDRAGEGRRRRERRSGSPRRNGRSGDRNGNREAADNGVTVRPRNGEDRSERNGDRAPPADRGRDRDEVVHADRIARDLGFGDGRDDRLRDGRADRLRDGRPGRDAVRRSHDDVGRFQFDTEVRERPRSRPGAALRRTQLEQLLVHETAASDGLSKPYLSDLPSAYAAERLLFDWLEFLVLKGGFKRTMDALRYYNTVGWLTDDVEADLRDYLVGFSGEVSDTDAFDVDDHHLSLVYIARLSSMT